MDVIRNLTLVTALVVRLSSFADPKFHPLKLAILDNRWTTFACSLRCLSLQTPLEDLAVIIPRDIKLVQLERFNLNISITYRSSDVDGLMREIILPFLTSHKDTLEFLVLNAEENFNLSSFLKEIPHIPRLSGFGLSQNSSLTSSDPTALSGHHHFLQTHQSHLLDLNMKFTPLYSPSPTTETWFTQEWCHVRLPKLCSLSLTLPQPPEHDARGAAPYLLQYTQTLTTLSLKPCRFSYEAASVLLPELGAGVLRTLELFVWAMSPDLLQLFAQHMPNLYSLKVNAKYYSPERDAQVAWGAERISLVRSLSLSGVAICVADRISNFSWKFCQAMKLVSFPDWKLDNFQWDPYLVPHLDELFLAMVTALPRVQSFWGRRASGQGSTLRDNG
jgi:hypothetical protein